MPLAVTHILVPIIFLEILRDSSSRIGKFFSKKYIFLVGVAGLLPDTDLHLVGLADMLGVSSSFPQEIQSLLGHRIIFHNLWVPIGFLLFFVLLYYILPKRVKARSKKQKKRKARLKKFGKVFLVLFIGWTIHLILDATLTGRVMPWYPLDTYMIDYDLTGRAASAMGMNRLTILVSMDALLLFFWLWHEETHHYIKDYF